MEQCFCCLKEVGYLEVYLKCHYIPICILTGHKSILIVEPCESEGHGIKNTAYYLS